MRFHLRAGILLAAVVLLVTSGRAAAQDVETCQMCHADASMFEGLPNAAQLAVDSEAYAESVHGVMGFTCVDCHQDLIGDEDFEHAMGGVELTVPECGMCHSDVDELFQTSLHEYARVRGNPRAPTCASCHGAHDILPRTDPRSRTNNVNVPGMCAACHGQAGLLTDQLVKFPETSGAYAQSVHGRAVTGGLASAASCSDCHLVHELKGPTDPESPINHRNVSRTCGTCHPTVQLAYDSSIHGRAVQAGIPDSPTCNDCHGEHLILSPTDTEAQTSVTHISSETCGTCHSDPIINAKYNLRGEVVGSYEDSYHGWAVQRNWEDAATCVSCHTAHEVLPASEPTSAIHPDNVVATCQQCHPDSDERFAASYTHEAASITLNPINRIIRSIYILLIVVVIGGMVVHNLVIMNYYVVERRKDHERQSFVLRFDLHQVIQHLLLLTSFTMLVITGFALRFPNAWWVNALSQLGMTEPVRATLHRVFAVVMVVSSVYHAWYLFALKRGREELRAMLPGIGDVREFVANLRFFTWRTKERAKFGRYDYTQKAEYWALIWGTAIMALTGFILWFPAQAVKILPSWAVPAAQTIHYYEAWLATLAIIIWHFFFVIFHPEEYPMSWTWLTGRMSEHSVKHHHARWYEEEISAPSERRENRADTEL